MTVNELSEMVADKFLFRMMDKTLLREAEWFATMIAKEHWPEVHSVTVELVSNIELKLNFVFSSQEDYVWWNLKNG